MDAGLSAAIKAALGTYPAVRDKYYEEIFVAVFDYLGGDGAITSFKNAMKRAMVEAFLPAMEIGWEDGGGTLPISDTAQEWLATMQAAEIEFINVLFQTLKETRKGEDVKKTEIAQARADGYCATLDKIYNYAKVAGAGDTMLTFAGNDGKENCTDCGYYKGKRKKASWWITNNAVPPNRDFECKGYRCQHYLMDDSGKVWTL